jgi:hypothetical protein
MNLGLNHFDVIFRKTEHVGKLLYRYLNETPKPALQSHSSRNPLEIIHGIFSQKLLIFSYLHEIFWRRSYTNYFFVVLNSYTQLHFTILA